MFNNTRSFGLEVCNGKVGSVPKIILLEITVTQV